MHLFVHEKKIRFAIIATLLIINPKKLPTVKLRKLTICICAIMLSINLYAQSDKGVLAIYRNYQLQGQGLKHPVMVNDSAVVMMKVGTLYKKSLPAGKYKVSAKTEME